MYLLHSQIYYRKFFYYLKSYEDIDTASNADTQIEEFKKIPKIIRADEIRAEAKF